MATLHHYRLTKYDPALRDENGVYPDDDLTSWTDFSDIGGTFGGVQLTLPAYLDVEARHLVALASFLEESGTSSVTAHSVEPGTGASFRISEGTQLSPVEAIEAVRQMLRNEGWCRLADGDRFYIHNGWDYYLYVGAEMPCPQSVALARASGLFVDEDFPSPYLD